MVHITAFIVPGFLVNIIALCKPCKLRLLHSIKIIIIKTLYNVCYTALFRSLENLVENTENAGLGDD